MNMSATTLGEIRNMTPTVSTGEEPDDNLVYPIVKSVLYVVEGLVIIFGNALTMTAVQTFKRLRLVVTNTFITSLAAADGIIGVLLIANVFSKLAATSAVTIRYTALFIRTPYYISFCTSMWTLLAIAVDRYIAVVHPFSYKEVVTVPRARTTVCVIWIYLFLIPGSTLMYYSAVAHVDVLRSGGLQDLLPKAIYFIMLGHIYVPLLGNVFIYSRIFAAILRRSKERGRFLLLGKPAASLDQILPGSTARGGRVRPVRASGVQTATGATATGEEIAMTTVATTSESGKLPATNVAGIRTSGPIQTVTAQTLERYHAIRFAKMMSLILGYLVFAWLPYVILGYCYSLNDPDAPTWYPFAFDFAIFLLYTNSAANAFIYGWQSKVFREAYVRLMWQCFHCGSNFRVEPLN